MPNSEEIKTLLNETAQNLEKNNMETFVVSSKEEAYEVCKKLLNKGDTVTMGGSMTIKECRIDELLDSGDYVFYDRSKATTDDEKEEIYRKAFYCNAYLSGSNAITKTGELYNVDGNSNRVAAMLFGSDKLIVVAGYNKIVKDINEAVFRVKTKAAPPNCERLSLDNYCRKEGKCVSLLKENPLMCEGCASSTRICCNYVTMGYQRKKDRVKVILVAEELGY